jgi:hypothetical protein
MMMMVLVSAMVVVVVVAVVGSENCQQYKKKSIHAICSYLHLNKTENRFIFYTEYQQTNLKLVSILF